ncbi:MAG: RNA 3'-terminal phosphate cyclase, partial [Candidatus Heimdallarchaeota archaeon]
MNCDIEIDGSIGGGSVLRVAVPLALGLNKSIKITNIRAARKRPGLRNQHLLGLEALATITGSELIGGFVGSQAVQFNPTNIGKSKSKIQINIDTAASVSLILQALSNYSFVSGNDIDLDFIGGGSHTNWSPNLEYVKYVTDPVFQKFGQKINVSLERVGFYPKVGARGNIKIESHLVNTPVFIEYTQISNIFITLIASSNLKKANVLERQLEILSNKLSSNYDITTKLRYEETPSSGTGVTVIVNYLSNVPKGISKLG